MADVRTPRPRLRGHIHLGAAVVSVVATVWLLTVAESTIARVAALVYGLSMVLLYGTSGTYHVFSYDTRWQRAMRRADHSMIFVLIAGTFTPVCLLAMGGSLRWVLLGFVWSVAVAGVVLKIAALERFPKTGATLHIGLGWCGVFVVPALIDRPVLLGLILAGGIVYTVGAVLFALARPRLSETWFGFHELWHTLGVTAGALMFAANFALVSSAS